MRKLVLLVVAGLLLLAPPAFAAGHDDTDSKGRSGSVCRAPDIDVGYELEAFAVAVSLPASGCETREDTTFDLSVATARVENEGADRDLVQRTVSCGPFRSADDFEGRAAPRSSCNLTVFVGHPDSEEAEYAVDVSYPGAAAPRTASLYRSCVSDGATAACQS